MRNCLCNPFCFKTVLTAVERYSCFPETLKVETEEVSNAERLWVKSLQNVSHDNPNYDQLKDQLGFVLTEDGILRCRGRLQHSKQSYLQKYPALLPSDPYVTALIIRQFH